MYRLPSQTSPIRYHLHTSIILGALIIAVMILLPVVLSRAVQLGEELQAARHEVTDDQTWVVAQLEVEYLKLALAVGDLRSAGSEPLSQADLQRLLPNVMERFDIFYSRVGTVASAVRLWSETSDRWRNSLRLLDRVTQRRDVLAGILDQSAQIAAPQLLGAIEVNMEGFAEDVRNLSVATLTTLSSQATERRLNYISKLRALLIQSVTMVIVMVIVSLLALHLYRQVGIRAAAERRLSENLYRVFDAKPDAIMLTDTDRRVLWKNKAAAELLDQGPTEGTDLLPVDRHFPGLQRMARTGRSHPLEQSDQSCTFRDIIRRTDGAIVSAEVTRIPLVAENGQTTNVLFVRDISETQRALRALRRERRMAEAEAERYQRFLAVMSHEIRSPLHAVMAALDLARERPEAASLADLHNIATDAARVALGEADAVLEIGRAEHEMHGTERGFFSPSEIVDTLVEMNGPAAHRAGTKLAVEIMSGTEDLVQGLRACFWHAVANLLSNAVKFTRDGVITLRLSRTDDNLRVEVSDTGPGITPGLKEVIFRDHYTRDPVTGASGKGAGLGLGLFVEAVRAMGGQYGLESVPGEGATFWFIFPAPVAEIPSSANVHATPASAEFSGDLRVLVVDDSHVNRALIRQMFSTLGLHADLADSGTEAVKQARALAYDLILMDLTMPHMDGYAAAAEIRRAGASQSAAIVALTANLLARQEVLKPGSAFSGFLLKPLRLDELRAWLSGSLEDPRLAIQASVPLIDPEIVHDILDMLPQDAVGSLLTTLFDEARNLVEPVPSKSDQDLSVKFHKVAGSAGMLGAGRLRALALEGEIASKAKDSSPSLAFRAAWTRTISETSRAWSLLLESRQSQVKAIER